MLRAADVEAQVEMLRHLDLAGLRALWRQRYGAPPRLRSPDLLRRMLAFELQADVHGGLRAELRQALRRARTASPRRPALQPGTTITREWRGARHVVQVVEAGFVYQGITYVSLSEVARTITGARWSGPRFFGLADSSKTLV